MRLLVEDIPSFAGGSAAVATSVTSRSQMQRSNGVGSRFDRRVFLRRTIEIGMGIGIMSLGIFPPARQALASHVGTEGYKIKPLPCPLINGADNCSPGCGPSDVYSDSCQTAEWSHYYGWHKATCPWTLRLDECHVDPDGDDWDGWRWDFDPCGCCCPINYRCHDGYKRTSGSCDFVDESICRWTMSCTTCPRC
jgi:hypothetical protein